jgi:hypothetical protein
MVTSVPWQLSSTAGAGEFGGAADGRAGHKPAAPEMVERTGWFGQATPLSGARPSTAAKADGGVGRRRGARRRRD